jgi:hypothetical protein
MAPATSPATPAFIDIVLRHGRRATPMIKLAVRDDAIVGTEHRCSQPPDATDEVVLQVQAKTTHPTFRQSEVTAFP